MTTIRTTYNCATALLLATSLLAGVACAQAGAQGSALDRRITAVAHGMVQFHFAARGDTCGDGARFIRTGDDSWHGSWIDTSDPVMRSSCERGPVRVVVALADREVVRVEAFVGPLRATDGANDLGAVNAREASAWLLGLAARSEGRPARDAILPAMLADSATPTPALLAIARDTDRPRDTRRGAISWIARAGDTPGNEAARALATLARDERDAPTLRQNAVSALLRIPRGEGIAALTTLAQEREDTWLGREATKVVARSGDPRAREFLRRASADTRLPEDLRAAAMAGLGNDMATGADARLLRDSYRTLSNEKTREAVMGAVANVGGSANADWLMGIAKDRDASASVRRRAIGLAERAGATGKDLVALYDAVEDTDARGAVISALGQEGSKPSRDKLVAIAQSSDLPQLRRRAISALERHDGAEVREALAAIAARP